MFKKTHLIIGLFVALFFLPYIRNKTIFFPVVLISSLIPDLDTILFPQKDYRLLKMLKKESYKNFMHSYTFCILLSAVLAFFYPVLALPFFLGYSFHLFFDSITVNGIAPFWPFRVKTKGFIVPGGMVEKTIKVILLFLSVLLVLRYLL